MAVVIGSRQGPGRALKTTQGAEVKGNPEISPHSPAYAPAGAVPAIMRKTRVVPLTSRRHRGGRHGRSGDWSWRGGVLGWLPRPLTRRGR